MRGACKEFKDLGVINFFESKIVWQLTLYSISIRSNQGEFMNFAIKLLSVLVVGMLAMILEVSHPGPYTEKFNNQKEKVILDNQLLGVEAEKVVQIIGGPDRVIQKENGQVLLEYLTYSAFRFSRFQLKIVDGKLEKFRKFVF